MMATLSLHPKLLELVFQEAPYVVVPPSSIDSGPADEPEEAVGEQPLSESPVMADSNDVEAAEKGEAEKEDGDEEKKSIDPTSVEADPAGEGESGEVAEGSGADGEAASSSSPKPSTPPAVVVPEGSVVISGGVQYQGQFAPHMVGVPHGQGTIMWPTGAQYSGEFTDGQPTGSGQLTWYGHAAMPSTYFESHVSSFHLHRFAL